jgi:hypothetical protein
MQCELNPPADAAPGLLQALCSVAVGSLAGLVSGVLICAVVVQLAGCAAAGLPVAAAAPAAPAVPAVPAVPAGPVGPVAAGAASADDPCDPRARLCR